MSDLEIARSRLKQAISARVPVLLVGSPGVGKTAQAEEIAAEMEMGFVAVSVPTRPPEEFSGIPVPHDGVLEQQPLSWLRRAIRLSESQSGGCLVLFDEFGCALPSTQAALLGLTQSRYCGDTTVPMEVAFVAATNPTAQSADGWMLPLPTLSRWTQIQWPQPTVDEWISWLWTAKGYSGEWTREGGQKARALVSAFLYTRPSQLLQLPSNDGGDIEMYPCPRSWYSFALQLAESQENIGEATEGTLGKAVSVEFAEFMKKADLPNPEVLLQGAEKWKPYKGRADKTLAALLSAVGAVICNVDELRLEQVAKLIQSAAVHGQSGVALVAAKSLLRNKGVKMFDVPRQLASLIELVQASEK